MKGVRNIIWPILSFKEFLEMVPSGIILSNTYCTLLVMLQERLAIFFLPRGTTLMTTNNMDFVRSLYVVLC